MTPFISFPKFRLGMPVFRNSFLQTTQSPSRVGTCVNKSGTGSKDSLNLSEAPLRNEVSVKWSFYLVPKVSLGTLVFKSSVLQNARTEFR
jgi:hypothetical protein